MFEICLGHIWDMFIQPCQSTPIDSTELICIMPASHAQGTCHNPPTQVPIALESYQQGSKSKNKNNNHHIQRCYSFCCSPKSDPQKWATFREFGVSRRCRFCGSLVGHFFNMSEWVTVSSLRKFLSVHTHTHAALR